MRRLNYLLHGWLGIGCAFFLAVAGLTGALLVFAEEIDGVMYPEWHHVTPAAEVKSLSEVLAALRLNFPEHDISGITLAGAPGSPHQVWLVRQGRYSQAFVDPHSAALLGVRETPWISVVIRLHYSLLLGDWGGALMFLPACGMLLLGTTGLWIHRSVWRSLLQWPRFHRSLRLGFSDLHKAAGVPLYVFLLVLGFTGAYLNLGFLVTAAMGKARAPWDIEVRRTFQPASLPLDAAVLAAKQRLPGLIPYYIGFPRDGSGILNIFGTLPGQEIFGPYGSRVGLDAKTGEVRQLQDIRTLKWSEKWKELIAPLHFGNFGGFWVRLIYGVASLGIVILTVTGTGIWWVRRKKRQS